jgi:hypothetical protein
VSHSLPPGPFSHHSRGSARFSGLAFASLRLGQSYFNVVLASLASFRSASLRRVLSPLRSDSPPLRYAPLNMAHYDASYLRFAPIVHLSVRSRCSLRSHLFIVPPTHPPFASPVHHLLSESTSRSASRVFSTFTAPPCLRVPPVPPHSQRSYHLLQSAPLARHVRNAKFSSPLFEPLSFARPQCQNSFFSAVYAIFSPSPRLPSLSS